MLLDVFGCTYTGGERYVARCFGRDVLVDRGMLLDALGEMKIVVTVQVKHTNNNSA